MKRFVLLAIALLSAPAAHADMTNRIQSSIQLQVDGAGSISERIGSSYAVSGSNITLDTVGGLGSLTPGSGVGYTAADYSVTTAGDAFTFSESFLEGDATPSATSVSAGVVPSLPMLGQTTTTSGGSTGALAGTIASDHALTLSAGGAGTSAIGQIVTELSID